MTIGTGPRSPGGWPASLLLALLALSARVPALDRLGLHGDEDISTLTMRGILNTGLPSLPSGKDYLRAPLFHYLVAPLAAPGLDWVPRLASVAASTVTAILLYRLGSRWVGRPAAFVGTALYGLSIFEIDIARQARFYALFQLAALLAFWAIYRFWTSEKPFWGWLSAGAVFVAMTTHELGGTVALPLLFVAVRARSPRAANLASAALVLLGALTLLQMVAVNRAVFGGEQSLPLAPRLEVSLASAASAAKSASPIALVGGGVLGVIALALALGATRGQPVRPRIAFAVALASSGAAAGVGEVGLAGAALALTALQSTELLGGGRGTRAFLSVVLLAAVASLIHAGSGLAVGIHPWGVLMMLGGAPLRMTRGLLLLPPLIVAGAVLICSVVLVRSWRGRASDGERFLVLTVLGVTALRGLLAGKSQVRYLADLWPLWELLAGLGAVVAVGAAARLPLLRPAPRLARVLAGGMIAICALTLPGTSPAQTLAFLFREPGDPAPAVLQAPPFVPDLRGAAAWLSTRLEPDVPVAATDWLSTYCYLGRLDVWIRSSGYETQSVLREGVVRDIYLGAEVAPDIETVQALAQRGPLWVVAGGLELEHPDAKLDPHLRKWLKERPAEFTARDGRTRVLRLGPGDAAPSLPGPERESPDAVRETR